MAFEGMDVDQVTGVANQLGHQADQIDNVISSINGLVSQLSGIWQGKDATEFEGWWNNQHMPALKHASEAVHGLRQSALNNVSAQQQASAH
jgi:uncharacterized protein YukE